MRDKNFFKVETFKRLGINYYEWDEYIDTSERKEGYDYIIRLDDGQLLECKFKEVEIDDIEIHLLDESTHWNNNSSNYLKNNVDEVIPLPINTFRNEHISIADEDNVDYEFSIRFICDKGLWSELCDLAGFNHYAINEGLMDKSETIRIKKSIAKKLNLI